MSIQLHVIKAIVDPSIAPTEVGQHWVNTLTSTQWLSVGTATVADWRLIGFVSSEWSTSGNSGSGLILGTSSNDDWSFISNALVRGGFKASGEMFLKTHALFSGSEKVNLTSAVQTIGATPTSIFILNVPSSFSGRLTCSVQGRKDDGTQRSAFERSALFYREGASASLSSKVHTQFTDKSQAIYDLTMVASGSTIIAKVTGKAGETINWSGSFEYQMIGSNL